MKKISLILLTIVMAAALMVTGFAADNAEAPEKALPVFTGEATGDTLMDDTTEWPDMYAIPSTLNDGYNIYHRHSSMQLEFGVYGNNSRYSFFVGIQDDEYLYDAKYYPLNEINQSSDDFAQVIVEFDLSPLNLPVGTYTIIYGIIDAYGNPYDYFYGFDITLRASGDIDLLEDMKLALADEEGNLTYIEDVRLCPGEEATYQVVLLPNNVIGNRLITVDQCDPEILEVETMLGLVHVKAVAPGTSEFLIIHDDFFMIDQTITVEHDYQITAQAAPTCDEDGYTTYTCSCGDTYTETVPALGHDHQITAQGEPTCTEDGYITYTCECGYGYTETVPALGHSYGENPETVLTPPTACIPGEAVCHCDTCDTDVTYPIAPVFSDVEANRFYTAAVDYFYAEGIVNGITTTKFGPDDSLTRGMLVTFLYRMDGTPACDPVDVFTDVESGRYFTTPIAWAYTNGITMGITNTTFEPETPITRQQLATFLYRYAKYKNVDTTGAADISTYPDAADVSKFAKEAMAWAVETGIITGTPKGGQIYLDPTGNATRAQAVTMLYRYMNYAAEHPAPEAPVDPETPDDTETPTDPETPDDTETPTVPETPDDTETPTVPETPTDPETSDDTETPTDPETPAEPDDTAG